MSKKSDEKISEIREEIEKMKKKYGDESNNKVCFSHSSFYWLLGIIIFLLILFIIYFYFRPDFTNMLNTNSQPIKHIRPIN